MIQFLDDNAGIKEKVSYSNLLQPAGATTS
jgi:hypothetical protein